ncbi:putative transferase CAF17, mitochondrial [Podospora aff. communis PSN243]|uniref:Iron-sulfur cluster assembly factor IBA57 homolog, mitochondrial n=1 Tax=Podospora aff. communis PSN243 TaxID=3040156 RepID=A0AAV9H6G4_9PEZI|nr:putative transferase CAF17, mitochondrial [Podospora aff. communis PSN243]
MQSARRALALTKAATPFACRAHLAPSTSQFRRTLTTSAAPAPHTSPAPSGIAPLTSRRLISVSGPDAEKYLHGVITANILPFAQPTPTPSPITGRYAAFLTAQGRVLHDVLIYRDTANLSALPDGPSPRTTFLIEVDSSEAERLTRHIKRYKLRANFTVRPLPSTTIYHAWSDTSPLTLPATQNTNTLPDPRLPTLGHRILCPEGTTPPPLDVPSVSEAAYHLRRYLNGIPEGQSEILRESALPQESNLDLLGAIDFRKGCYVGQELTIRTKHRGVVRKRILPVMLYSAGHAPPAEMVYRPQVGGGEESVEGLRAEMVTGEVSIGRVGKKGRSAGKWLRGVGNVGLALCRLEIMTGLSLPGDQGMASGGFQEGDEFMVGVGEGEGGQEVRVKAFVPGWMRAGLEGNGQ